MGVYSIKRDPALWAAAGGTLIKLLGAFLINLTTEQQAALNAITAAVIGVIVAEVTHDGQPAAILGFIQAAVALAVGLGLKLSPDQQAVMMSFAGTVLMMFVRTQVTAPVPPRT